MNWRDEIPARIQRLPVNKDGYPVPWFVATVDGVPDFRVVKPEALKDAVQDRLCWICGEPLGVWLAFVIGPMCAINRTSSEPPSHKECAVFSAKACPFLSNPERPRRLGNMPAGAEDAAGIPIARNSGVTLIWITRSFVIEREPNGILFTIGECLQALWYARGRAATREEVLASIDSGFPLLEDMARQDGPEALEELARRRKSALLLLP